MPQKRNIKAGLQLIKDFEGLRLKAYKDSVGIWTIGYGTIRLQGMPVGPNDALTGEAQALQLLLQDVESIREPAINSLVKVQLTDNEFSALLSFTYNLGVAALARSTLLKLLNANRPRALVAAEFSKWNKADGVELAGLTRRRAAEAALFLQPDARPAHGSPLE